MNTTGWGNNTDFIVDEREWPVVLSVDQLICWIYVSDGSEAFSSCNASCRQPWSHI